MPCGLLTSARDGGIPGPELVEDFLHQRWIELHPCRGFPEERRKFWVVLVAGLPAVGGPVAQLQLIRCLNRSSRGQRAPGFVLKGGCEIAHVEKRAGLRSLGLDEHIGHLG